MKQLVSEAIRLCRQGEYGLLSTRGKNKLNQIINKNLFAARRINSLQTAVDDDRRLIGDVLELVRKQKSPIDDISCFDRINARRSKLLEITTVSRYNEYVLDSQYELGDQSAKEADKTVKANVAEAAKCPDTKGRILYYLIRSSNLQSGLELGTSVGMSGLYQATALQQTGGKIVTLEGSKIRAAVAEKTFEATDLDNITVIQGVFTDTLPGVLENHSPFDFVFIDGHHDETATKQYWDMIKPEIEDRGVVVFDDIHWSSGMERAWREICHDDQFDPIVETNNYGIGIAKPNSRTVPERVSI